METTLPSGAVATQGDGKTRCCGMQSTSTDLPIVHSIYILLYMFVGADGERSRRRRRSATDAAYPLRVHIGPANIAHPRRIRRCVLHSTAACFTISLRSNDSRWERCLHAGGAVVQFCREIPVCWPQCFSTGFFCGLRYNPIRIQRLFLHTFSDKPDGTKLQTSEAFAIWRGRTTERRRPAACGGARNVEFVRTNRRRHSCGVAASTAVR